MYVQWYGGSSSDQLGNFPLFSGTIARVTPTICFRFPMHFALSALSLAREMAGTLNPAKSPMMEITTRSSTRVNPKSLFPHVGFP
jgi:hypothetical protein